MTYWISIDGPNGVGKTTAIGNHKVEWAKNNEVYFERFPSGSREGTSIRALMDKGGLEQDTMALLNVADATQALLGFSADAGDGSTQPKMLVSDRGVMSTAVYQWDSRVLVMDLMKRMFKDKVTFIYLDPLDTEIGFFFENMQNRGKQTLAPFVQKDVDQYRNLILRYRSTVDTFESNGFPVLQVPCTRDFEENGKLLSAAVKLVAYKNGFRI